MTITLIILTASVLLILFYILFSNQVGNKPQATKVNRKASDARSTEAVKFKEKTISADMNSLNKSDITPAFRDEDLDVPDVHAGLKHFLQTGIEHVFNKDSRPPSHYLVPLMRRDIKPGMLDTVKRHISSLKNIHTEQARLQKMINDPSVQMPDFSKIILSDPVLTAKILRMANSSYFGIQQKIDSISHALMILGLQNIKNIIYREGMSQVFQAGSAQKKDAVAALWRYSSLTSVCASFLYDMFDGLNMGTLFTLGIIHDIGKLIIMELPQAREHGNTFWEKYPFDISIWEEDQLLGINHAVIGGLALEQWNFSELMINVINMHHAPSYTDADSIGLTDEQLKYVTVLFIADQIAKLFADWTDGIIRAYSLLDSYHLLIDKNRLIKKIKDTNFLAQIRDAETMAISEQQNKSAIGGEITDDTAQFTERADRNSSRGRSYRS